MPTPVTTTATTAAPPPPAAAPSAPAITPLSVPTTFGNSTGIGMNREGLSRGADAADMIDFDPNQQDANLDAAWGDEGSGDGATVADAAETAETEFSSTLAEDDEMQVSKATNLFTMAMQTPQLLNPQTARNRLLRAYGEGGRIAEWEPPPPQGPPPAPPMEAGRISISVAYTDLPGEVQMAVNKQLIASATASGSETVPPDAVPTPEQQSMDELGGLMRSMAADDVAGEGEGGLGTIPPGMVGDAGGSPFVS